MPQSIGSRHRAAGAVGVALALGDEEAGVGLEVPVVAGADPQAVERMTNAASTIGAPIALITQALHRVVKANGYGLLYRAYSQAP